MELVTIVIGIAVCIISALMIYCISAFSMREKTFEEVIEEQRRREEAEREKLKAEKRAEREQQKKKYKKGKHDKGKDKVTRASETELKAEHKMLNLEIEPEIIEPTGTLGLNAGPRQKGKKEKTSKPILHNKDEHTPVVEKAAELHHKQVTPKDEVELKKTHEKVIVEKIEKVKVIHTTAVQQEKEGRGKPERQAEKETRGKHVEGQHEKEAKGKSHEKESKGRHTEGHEKEAKGRQSEGHEKETKGRQSEGHEKEAKGKLPQGQYEKETKVKHAEGQHDKEAKRKLPQGQHEKETKVKQAEGQHDKEAKGKPQGQHEKEMKVKQAEGQHDLEAKGKLPQGQHEKETKVKQAEGQHEKETKRKLSAEVKEANIPKKIEKDEDHKSKQHAFDADKFSTKQKALADDVEMNGPHLISSVKNAKLTDSEVQSLVEILLNKHGLSAAGAASSEAWSKKSQKGDPAALLKKQLEEKEKALKEEQATTASVNNRIKDLRNELLAEKSKYTALEKKSQEQRDKLQAEMEALVQRMQSTHDHHLQESSNLQAKIRGLEQGNDKEAVHKLTEENKIVKDTLSQKVTESKRLEDKLKQTEKELSNSRSTIQAGENAKKALESKISTFEEQIQKLQGAQKEVDSVTNRQVEEVSQELRKAEAKNASLTSDLQKATNGLNAAEMEMKTLKTRLHELEAHLTNADKQTESKLHESEHKCSVLEGNVKNLENQLSGFTSKLSGCQTEIIRLQQENRKLLDENKTFTERLQTAPASNGSMQENGPSLSVADHERIISGKDKELTELVSGLETQKAALSSLQSQINSKSAEISDLQEQLSQQRNKNNELNSETEKYDKKSFQRLFPDVKVSESLSHKEWVTAFEKQALENITKTVKEDRFKELESQNKELHKRLDVYEKQVGELNSQNEKLRQVEVEHYQLKSSQSASSADHAAYTQLQQDNSRLQSELEGYRNIVSETENKVRQLEKSIDDEERKWQEKFKQTHSQQDAGLLKKTIELESLVSQQENQIQEYRKVLSLTDNRLKTLESKVKTEEDAWQEKYHTTHSELTKAKSALTNMKQEFHVSQGSQDMQTRVKELEEELQEAQEKIIVITQEKETVITQFSETQHHQVSSVDTENLQKQLLEVRSQLESEHKRNKDLSLNIVKLNGIIKTGQDALSQEQGLVKKLQESLDSKSLSSGTTELEEIDQLRFKLSEKQKLLEREMSANKQLSERLAQLGVLAASTSDSGTSV